MTDHERAARKAAFDEAMKICGNHNSHYAMWNAARAYEPPKICDEGRVLHGFARYCSLLAHNEGDHRQTFSDGSYIGWPRT